jgi:hypothetical protein
MVSVIPCLLYSKENSPKYATDRNLDGYYSQSGYGDKTEKFAYLPGIKPQPSGP